MRDRFDYSQIPPRIMAALEFYVEKGVPTGGFLNAVLCNNLSDATGLADRENMWLLPVYTAWLYNEAPINCHGSPEKVKAWLARFAEQREAAAR